MKKSAAKNAVKRIAFSCQRCGRITSTPNERVSRLRLCRDCQLTKLEEVVSSE